MPTANSGRKRPTTSFSRGSSDILDIIARYRGLIREYDEVNR